MKKPVKFALVLLAVLAIGATVKKISDYPAVTTPANGDLFLLASGPTNKNVSYANLKTSVLSGGTALSVNGTNATTTPNLQDTATVTWARSGSNLTATAVGMTLSVNGTNATSTPNVQDTATVTWARSGSNLTATAVGSSADAPSANYYTINHNYQVGKGGHLTVTNEVRFPFAPLTLSGTNVSTISLTNSSMFKLTLGTNDAFFGAPTDLPTTNAAQTFQIFVKQDSVGGRAIRFTNSYWIISGSGTSSNAQPAITTNANSVSLLTFTTSPFTDQAYGVVTPGP